MPITINGSGTVTGISTGGLPDGCIATDDLANNAVTTAKLGSGEASGLCKAWVNFNGTGTVAIRASYNVSSITDNGVGDYTVNFTTAMVDANYAVLCTQGDGRNDASLPYMFGLTPGTYNRTISILAGSVRLYSASTSAATYDALYNYVAIFR